MLGAIIGDIAGSAYEFNPTNDYNFEMFTPESNYTDDTICTVAVADAILKKFNYGKSIHWWCSRNACPKGGYGGRFRQWVLSKNPLPYGSFGNGSAMRVSPVAWAADAREDAFTDEGKDYLLEQAALTASCTHNHPEGIKGAQTVALAIYAALKHPNKEYVLEECVAFSKYNINIRKESVQNRFDETCQGTVPVALWIIDNSISFEDAVRKAVSLGADADTLGAIVGSIAEALWGIPEDLATRALSYLPSDMKTVFTAFTKKFHQPQKK